MATVYSGALLYVIIRSDVLNGGIKYDELNMNRFSKSRDCKQNNKTHIVEVSPEVRALEHREPVT
jgi:hypothetical protein